MTTIPPGPGNRTGSARHPVALEAKRAPPRKLLPIQPVTGASRHGKTPAFVEAGLWAGAAALGPDGNAHSLCVAQEEVQTHEICKKIQYRRFLRKGLCSCTMDSPGGWGGVSKNNGPRDQKGVVKWEQVRVQIPWVVNNSTPQTIMCFFMTWAVYNNMNSRGPHGFFRNPYGFFVFFRCSVEDKSFCCGPHRFAQTQKTGKKS